MYSKKEILILELTANKINAERKFDRVQTMRKLKIVSRIVYTGCICALGFIVYLSFILEISPIQIFNF